MKRLILSLKRQKQFCLKSQGQSMRPLLYSNDILYFKNIIFSDIKINDLIILNKYNNLFTHRVIYKSSNYLITKGDNNVNSDGFIYPKQIFGKVYLVKRNGQLINPESFYLLQSTLYFQEIIKIKKKFEREKIEFVFLKGLPLHLYYEKKHPRRIYLDCDVLVRPINFLKAEQILFNAGYKKVKTELSSSHEKMKDKEIENAYFKIINNFRVVFDLHIEVVFMMTQLGKLNALYSQKLIDQLTNEFLINKRKITIHNETFPILLKEYLILYIALHFFHHNFKGAFRLEFLDSIIHKEKLDNILVKLLSKIIIKYQLQNFVYPVAILLNKLYKTSIPSRLLQSIQPSFSILNYLSPITNHSLLVFNDESRIKAGIHRFKYLFHLSPNPWYIKIWIFANPKTIFSIYWVLKRKLFSFSSNH